LRKRVLDPANGDWIAAMKRRRSNSAGYWLRLRTVSRVHWNRT